ncbi:PREDICTED: uncharacterized protein LOC108549387 [Eufriesea mexicana]|uniref:uncharacterized protein LOC108549387 n=1 Tax=Eufriesea mexicana TaxID=516756 RepID=UPI00083C0902|nr:PREDICTED: uncharacterized protein LOC108549387 [Eufriesea mexicana]
MTFWSHTLDAANRAAAEIAALCRLRANMKELRPSMRILLMTVFHLIIPYGAEILAAASLVAKYRKTITAVQRSGALRIARAYRYVSEAAVLVIAGVIPIDLLDLERKSIYESSEEKGRTMTARAARTADELANPLDR